MKKPPSRLLTPRLLKTKLSRAAAKPWRSARSLGTESPSAFLLPVAGWPLSTQASLGPIRNLYSKITRRVCLILFSNTVITLKPVEMEILKPALWREDLSLKLRHVCLPQSSHRMDGSGLKDFPASVPTSAELAPFSQQSHPPLLAQEKLT